MHTAARRLISRPVEPAPSPQRTNTRRRLCSRLVASTLPSRLYIPGVNIARPTAENRLPRASLRFVADSTSRAEIELPVFDSSTLASAAVARASGETDPSLSWLFALEESHSEAVHSHFEIRAALVAAHNLSFPSPSHLCQELAQAELLQGVEARHRDTLHLLAEQQVRNREQEQVISDLILQVDTANRIAAALTLPRGYCDSERRRRLGSLGDRDAQTPSRPPRRGEPTLDRLQRRSARRQRSAARGVRHRRRAPRSSQSVPGPGPAFDPSGSSGPSPSGPRVSSFPVPELILLSGTLADTLG